MAEVTVGRTVHYVSYGTPGGEFTSECRSAIVTEVANDGKVSLAVFNPSGLFFDRGLEESVVHRGGTWHWPERV